MMKLEQASAIKHADLIEACKLYDRKAQERIYDLYSRAMYNASYRIVADAAQAEDIMQDSFIEAFQKISLFRGEGEFGGWLKRIVINNSINYLRSKREMAILDNHHQEVPDTKAEEQEIAENLFCRLEEIRQAMRKLSDDYRNILSLHLLEGYDHQEIAEVLQISYNNVRTRYSRAKQKLLQIIMHSRSE
jgi:RNA polymerase sigma-70 factor (ECF subfamily)